MNQYSPEQGTLFELDRATTEVVPVPIGLRAEGLSRVLGYYDNLGRTNLAATHERLGEVATQVFSKTYGVRELIQSGIDEAMAQQMANDFYFGTNETGYNPEEKSFLNSYRGKTRKQARKDFRQVLGAQVGTIPAEDLTPIAEQLSVITPRQPVEQEKDILPRHARVVQAARYEGVDGSNRITLGRLIKLAGEGIDEPWMHEEPSIPAIKGGLYIPPQDPRFAQAELLVRVAVDLKSTAPDNVGVVFPPEEFRVVARSPRDLARHMQAETRRANQANEDPNDVAERSGRAAGHVLTQKIAAMVALNGTLEGHRDFLRKMYKEVGSSWIAHYKSTNLEKHRVTTDEMIHDVADVAAVNLNYGSEAIYRLHDGIMKKLYGGNRSHAQISEQWQDYITLVGKYIGMRLVKIKASVKFSEDELSTYQPFLDRKQAA